MAPETPAWVHRWQQAADDELLYVDQTLRVTSWPDADVRAADELCWEDQAPEEEA